MKPILELLFKNFPSGAPICAICAPQALAASGGLTLRGTHRGIRVHRRSTDGAVQETTPGLQETLQQDDVVFVRESLF